MDFTDEDKAKMFDKIREYLNENFKYDFDDEEEDNWDCGEHYALSDINDIVRGG